MSLKEIINRDLTDSMKAKDVTRTETLRSIRAEILKDDKSGKNREMTPEEEIQLLDRQAKMRKESIEIFEKAGRMDLVNREKAQLDIINEYLPKQITKEDAEKFINDFISGLGELSAKDLGKVMGPVMKELKGKIDGKIVQEIVKMKLGI